MMKSVVCLFVVALLAVPSLQQSQIEGCQLPLDVGPCKASVESYYYNSETKKCEMFYYGGCHGNVNNFETIKMCQGACQAANEA